MRGRCAVAIDQAAHNLVTDLELIELPSSGLKARLKGDLQSLDQDGVRYCYFLRPTADAAPPQWLGNFGTHVREVDKVQVLGVYYSANEELREAYRSAGLGLLVLQEDDSFELVVSFDDVAPKRPSHELISELAVLRRDLERKFDVAKGDLTQRSGAVNRLTQDMPPAAKTQYVATIDAEFRLWTEWADRGSRDIDQLHVKVDHQLLDDVRARVHQGAIDSLDSGIAN